MAYLDQYGNPIPAGQETGTFTNVPMMGMMQAPQSNIRTMQEQTASRMGGVAAPMQPAQQARIGGNAPLPSNQGGATGGLLPPGTVPGPITPDTPVPSGPEYPGTFAGGFQKEESADRRSFIAPNEATIALFDTIKGMSGLERQSYLTSLQENLTQRLQRYQTLMSRGFGGEMDETANRDYEAITQSLKDVTRMINDTSYMDELMRMSTSPFQTGGLQPGRRMWVPIRPNEYSIISSR